MRYQDVVYLFEEFAKARSHCSREWLISDTLVMCVEVDMTSMTSMALPNHSRRDAVPGIGILRVSYHRFDAEDLVMSWCDDAPSPAKGWGYLVQDEERRAVYDRRCSVTSWAMGKVDELPPSTSTKIADRLRNGA